MAQNLYHSRKQQVMFQSLIEQPQVSQEILSRITGELIGKYQLKQMNSLHEFMNDLQKVVQQLKLYNETLEQLSTQHASFQFKLLLANHQYSFKVIEFLGKIVKKVYPKPQADHSYPHWGRQEALCQTCNSHIQHNNIKQLQREIMDYNLYSFELLDEDLRPGNNEQLSQDERFATPEELLMKKMGSIQKNINERQVNLIRCIDDFENIRTDLILGLKKREFDREIDSFDLKSYALELTRHFLSNLNRIEDKISNLKKNVHTLSDESVQVNLTSPLSEGTQLHKTEPAPKTTNLRSDAEYRKLNDLKIKLEDSCRRYQVELREVTAKFEVCEAQNKSLSEELMTEKFKVAAIEKAVRTSEKVQEKAKKQDDDDKLIKETLLMLLSSQGMLAGEFTNHFMQNYLGNSSQNDEEMMPIIKETFKRTFDNIFNQRMSLNLPQSAKKQQLEEQYVKSKRKSKKKKSIRFPIENEGRQASRFGYRKGHGNFAISSEVNYKISFDNPALAHSRPSLHKKAASLSNYKKSVLYTEGSIKKKRNRYSKLSSILSESKENKKDLLQVQFSKKVIQTVQTEPNESALESKDKYKLRKSKLSRNYSQCFQSKDNVVELQTIKTSGKLKTLKISGISSAAIKEFLFINESQLDSHSQEAMHQRTFNKTEKKQLSIETLSIQSSHKKGKIILNLQEINYLTHFYSLLAKIHIVNTEMYTKLKNWIFSKGEKEKLKESETKQNMILKKIVSEIIFKHRECQLSASLCPHLNLFLREMENVLSSQQQ